MKKTLLTIIAASILLLCSACGSSITAEGTWYSVTDATMYNFKGGEITVSGVTAGQYEANKDSVVVSMLADGKNLQLYITKADGVDVLADVKNGDGNIYFCKGLENAQAMIKAEALRIFQEYIEETLLGTWTCLGGNESFDSIEITDDGFFISYSGEGTGIQRWTDLSIGYAEGDQLCAVLTIADNDAGDNAWELPITLSDSGYEQNILYFGTIMMKKA